MLGVVTAMRSAAAKLHAADFQLQGLGLYESDGSEPAGRQALCRFACGGVEASRVGSTDELLLVRGGHGGVEKVAHREEAVHEADKHQGGRSMARQVRAVADKHAAFGGFEGGGAHTVSGSSDQGSGVARRSGIRFGRGWRDGV